MYDNPDLMGGLAAHEWNDGSSLDMNSAGWLKFVAGKLKKALKAATAKNEGVRNVFKNKGIGAIG